MRTNDTSGGAAQRAGHAISKAYGNPHTHTAHETYSVARARGTTDHAVEAMSAAEKSLKDEGFKSKGQSSSARAVTVRLEHADGREARVVSEHGGRQTTVRVGTRIPVGKANFSGRSELNDSEPEFASHIISVGDNGLLYATDVTELSAGIFSKRVIDESTGFMKIPATLSRTGVQRYAARELGLDKAPYNMNPSQIVSLNRPAEEVFAPDSLKSFESQTVAIDHPNAPVTAANWKQHAVGDVRDLRPNAMTVDCNVIIKDPKGMKALDSGKKYLSAGYSFELDMTPGRTSAGDTFDGVQRNIRGNHVALVNNPRGGPACKVADSTGEELMRVVTVDGIPVNVDDTGVAVLEKFLVGAKTNSDKLAQTIKVGDATFNIADAALQPVIDGLVKAKDEALKQAKTPEQIEALVNARVKVVGDATKLVPAIVTDGKTNAAIQREVITAVIAKDETSKKTVEAILGSDVVKAEDSLVATAFNVLVATGVAGGRRASASDSALSAALTRTSGSTITSEVVDSGTELVGRAKMIAEQNRLHEVKKTA